MPIPPLRTQTIVTAVLALSLFLGNVAPEPWYVFSVHAKSVKAGQGEMSAEEAARGALLDTLYYRFDRWKSIFEKKISSLERLPKTVETETDLMKHYFFLAALDVELSHTLGFTSEYKIHKLEEECLANIRQAKKLAKGVLARPGLTLQQKAQAYLYLGAAEGYLGILEFGAGNLLQALINGFRADTHLEEALALDPQRFDAYLGLGVYRYSNSRLGGMENLIMQGGKDLRQAGIFHIEHAIRTGGITTPLAIKTLVWFYIAEEINPDNADLPRGHPLSPAVCRQRVLELVNELERRYFQNPPEEHFIGNKELAMMKAVQFILDGRYAEAKLQFEKILKIIGFLRHKKGYKINPQQEKAIKAGLKFCEAMLSKTALTARGRSNPSACRKINSQILFMKNGGAAFEYDVEKIRDELNSIFYQRLVDLSRQFSC
ncbi:MAG: hypothetical protein ACE5GQ_01610 [Nitrospinales bacterium]